MQIPREGTGREKRKMEINPENLTAASMGDGLKLVTVAVMSP